MSNSGIWTEPQSTFRPLGSVDSVSDVEVTSVYDRLMLSESETRREVPTVRPEVSVIEVLESSRCGRSHRCRKVGSWYHWCLQDPDLKGDRDFSDVFRDCITGTIYRTGLRDVTELQFLSKVCFGQTLVTLSMDEEV